MNQELIAKYGTQYTFKAATSKQVQALRSVAAELGISISQAVKYLDASFAYRNGEITREEFDYIQKNT